MNHYESKNTMSKNTMSKDTMSKDSTQVPPEHEEKMFEECCMTYDQLASLCQFQQTDQPVIHLSTNGRDNVLCNHPRVYKHELLKTPAFRTRVIEYYKSLGYSWIDIVVLNRHYWKIFLFQHNP